MTKQFDRDRFRLLDAETGTIQKEHGGRISVALIYPNTYHVGMSNLGFQAVYRILNALDGVVCERAFLPDPPPSGVKALSTLESGKAVAAFDMVAFSISFENDFPNLLTILDAANLPLLAADRDGRRPLVAAGGAACLLNPEPIAAFIDCFLIGEAEVLLFPAASVLGVGEGAAQTVATGERELPVGPIRGGCSGGEQND